MGLYRRVTYEDRCQIRAFLQVKTSVRRIAGKLGLNKSSIYREISRNKIGENYGVRSAHELAMRRRESCRRKLLIQEELEGQVLAQLFFGLSPEQISARLRLEKIAKVSHQTIYNYIEKDKQALRPYLRRYNRRGASRLRMKAHKSTNKLSIDNRPKIADQRKRIGDWERDSMYAANGKTLLVCIDRKSRLIKLASVKDKKVKAINRLTARLLQSTQKPVHTITNDNGPEFRYNHGIKTPVYYCYPRKPQQRGSVENAIGLIRQYIKRKTNLDNFTAKDIQAIENCLNFRPRKCLDYKTPFEVFYKRTVALAI